MNCLKGKSWFFGLEEKNWAARFTAFTSERLVDILALINRFACRLPWLLDDIKWLEWPADWGRSVLDIGLPVESRLFWSKLLYIYFWCSFSGLCFSPVFATLLRRLLWRLCFFIEENSSNKFVICFWVEENRCLVTRDVFFVLIWAFLAPVDSKYFNGFLNVSLTRAISGAFRRLLICSIICSTVLPMMSFWIYSNGFFCSLSLRARSNSSTLFSVRISYL